MTYVGTTRRFGDKTPDELASHIWMHGGESSSINYARLENSHVARVIKADARGRVARLFLPRVWPGPLSILTMPGLKWAFEREILGYREVDLKKEDGHPQRTHIASIEWDEAIFRCALGFIPKGEDDDIIQVQAPEFASDSYRTKQIARYHRGRFEDLAEWYVTSDYSFDAAWLDFSGPVSMARMVAIQRFWLSSIKWRLVVTAMNARWDADASAAIARAGGITEWFVKSLPGAQLILDDRYQSAHTPMLQIGVDRT